MNPVASIIVPCYNKAIYLAETLDSVINQSFIDWECVIVNDGSIDDTELIAKGYCNKDSRFKYIYQKNSGVSSARNNGIKESSGKYILPLDSDDLLSRDYLSEAVSYLESHPGCKLVYPLVEFIGARTGQFILPEYSYEREIWQNLIVCSAVYRRPDYDKTSGYNDNMRKGLGDWDFWLSFLSETDTVKRLDITGLYYRIFPISRNTQTLDHKEELCRQIARNHPDIYMKHYDSLVFLQSERESLDNELSKIRNSISYRVGEAIAWPYRKLFYGKKSK